MPNTVGAVPCLGLGRADVMPNTVGAVRPWVLGGRT